MKLAAFLVVLTMDVAAAHASNRQYAPYSEYEMTKQAEIALARSAAPARISSHATIKVLTRTGYEIAAQGDNGFVCMVLRSWSAAPAVEATYYSKLRAPICFDPVAARTVAPLEELRAKLGLEGKEPEAIAQEVAIQYGLGQLPKMESVAFGYMWSASQDTGPGVGSWHPHMMVYAPYYQNSTLGNYDIGSHDGPFVVNGGTPFSIVIVRVDDGLAIKTSGS